MPVLAQDEADSEEVGARQRKQLPEQRCTCSRGETHHQRLPGKRARSASSETAPNEELDSSIVSLASRTSRASSFPENSCKLRKYNLHAESELTAAQQRLNCTRKANERLQQKLKALTLQLSKGEDLIAELHRSRAELTGERNSLVRKCETFEDQLRSLQVKICELESQLQSMLGVNEEGPRVYGKTSNTVRSASGAMMTAGEDHNKMIEDLRVTYDSILTRTRDMFDKRLANLDKRLSISQAISQNSSPQLSDGDDEIRRQRQTLAEFRRQIESLMLNAEVYSKDFNSGVQNQSVEQLALLTNQLRGREGQIKEKVKSKRLLNETPPANGRLKPREEQHLREIKSAEAHIAELENGLRRVSLPQTKSG